MASLGNNRVYQSSQYINLHKYIRFCSANEYSNSRISRSVLALIIAIIEQVEIRVI